MMRSDSDHFQGVYDLLRKRTRLRIPEFEEILDSLRARKFEDGDK